MPDIIRLLPESIANQIAAGEVVQRPASVVKELLENCLDAEATSITLLFKDGGQTFIQVIDNGKGMTDTDARMCWERHATSKIREANDLFHLSTYGFRGEALASIASISQVEMKTRVEKESLGTRILIEAGEVKKQEPVNLLKGTSITVKNLFFNIPVRRNFLKSISVETRYIIEEFQRCAMSAPDVEMTLMNGSHEVYKLNRTSLEQRIEDVLSKNKNGKLLLTEEETRIVGIKGYVGSPEKARKTRGDQFLYVNGRFIREPYFHHAITNAFEGLIQADYHPFYVLFLEVDPEKIDVNVHPTKTEVKFEEGRAIYSMIKTVVQKALGAYHTSPVLEPTPGIYGEHTFRQGQDMKHAAQPPTSRPNNTYNPFIDQPIRNRQETAWEKLYEPFRDDGTTPIAKPEIQPELAVSGPCFDIGKLFQLRSKYIVAEINNQLYLIHQQLAHERVLYEKYRQQLNRGQTPSQQLLFPRTLEMHPADYAILTGLNEELVQLGFDISPFGANAVIVNGTPADLKKGEEKDLIEGLLELFKHNETALKLDKRENLARALAKKACMSTVTQMNEESMYGLLHALFACEHPGHTPAGKPVMVTFAPSQLEGFFTK